MTMNKEHTQILDTIAYNVNDYYKTDIMATTRKRGVSHPRQVFWFLARAYVDHNAVSLLSLARYCGRSNHATVLHGLNEVQRQIYIYPKTRLELFEIMNRMELEIPVALADILKSDDIENAVRKKIKALREQDKREKKAMYKRLGVKYTG